MSSFGICKYGSPTFVHLIFLSKRILAFTHYYFIETLINLNIAIPVEEKNLSVISKGE